MSERVERTSDELPGMARSDEWEVFLREDADETLQHAGSVSAPTRAVAREQATQLLGWSATDVWLCPADEIERVSTR